MTVEQDRLGERLATVEQYLADLLGRLEATPTERVTPRRQSLQDVDEFLDQASELVEFLVAAPPAGRDQRDVVIDRTLLRDLTRAVSRLRAFVSEAEERVSTDLVEVINMRREVDRVLERLTPAGATPAVGTET